MVGATRDTFGLLRQYDVLFKPDGLDFQFSLTVELVHQEVFISWN